MTDEPTPAPALLECLELGIAQAIESREWQIAAGIMPSGLFKPYSAILERAVELEDQSRRNLNLVRIALGGEAIPDPADPPPIRPDD